MPEFLILSEMIMVPWYIKKTSWKLQPPPPKNKTKPSFKLFENKNILRKQVYKRWWTNHTTSHITEFSWKKETHHGSFELAFCSTKSVFLQMSFNNPDRGISWKYNGSNSSRRSSQQFVKRGASEAGHDTGYATDEQHSSGDDWCPKPERWRTPTAHGKRRPTETTVFWKDSR